jgi:2-keto-4-pentenoate hydratase/2-oxohepta-3-ene-1,7-dioic acid hydratase in catechol pathway
MLTFTSFFSEAHCDIIFEENSARGREMKVISFSDDLGERVGLLLGDRAFDLTTGLRIYDSALKKINAPIPNTILGMIEGGLFDVGLFHDVLEFAERHNLMELLTKEEYKLNPPIKTPPKIIALGLNYSTHARESGRPVPEEPVIFQKASSCVVGPEDKILIKPKFGRVDPEVELAVLIGKRAKDVPRDRAGEFILGYTVMNDVTAREIQAQDFKLSQPWFRSKSMDTFGPMGPCILTKDEIEEPVALELELRVNGELRQKDNTANLIFDIPRLVEFISDMMTLEPGSVISTGTPEGIAPIHPGDVVEATVEGIGTLRNYVEEYPNGGDGS